MPEEDASGTHVLVCRVKHETPTKVSLQLTSRFRFHRVAVGETGSDDLGTQLGTSYRGQEGALQHPRFPNSSHVARQDCPQLGELAAASMSDEMIKV